jgi:hypothetical protein
MVTRRQPTSAPKRRKPAAKAKPVPTSRAFFDRLLEIGRSIPPEAWERIPRDAARNFDDYLESEKP